MREGAQLTMIAVTGIIGKRGESIAIVKLTTFVRPRRPLFYPQFLGDTHPTIDLLVERAEVPAALGIVPFFFIQIKATTRGYLKANGNLRAQISAKDIARLVSYPAPTYILGIDEPNELAYIVAATAGSHGKMSSLSTRHPLNHTALQELYDEVLDYWRMSSSRFTVSRFV